MQKFNNWLGDKLAFGLSTMAMFYVVSAFVILPLFLQRPHDLVGWIQYIVQSFFQGAALPVLGYVARKAGESQERVLLETHDTVMAEMRVVKEAVRLLHSEQKVIRQLVQLVVPPQKGGTHE